MNDNIKKLQEDLEAKEAAEREAAANNFNDNVELTEDEAARINEMRKDKAMMISESDIDGRTVNLPMVEYVQSMDKKVGILRSAGADSEKFIKLLNTGDIVKSADEMKREAREQALSAFRTLSVAEGIELSDDDYIAINDSAIKNLMDYFKLSRMDADIVIKKLAKMSLSQICAILPEQFVNVYVTEQERKANNIKAKERILASIGYLSVTGPELDYLNEYVDEENKLAVVSKRLMQCQIDFAEMLKDEKTMSEIINETLKLSPADMSIWAKYIRQPNRVHNEFAQRTVIQEKYMEAYTKILEEYPDVEGNEKARNIIMKEIMEARAKVSCYKDIVNLNLMQELFYTLAERLKSNKKTSMDYIVHEAIEAIERIRRSKQDVPFPGYHGEKKAEQIFTNYMVTFPRMLRQYNDTIDTVMEKNQSFNPAPVVKVEVDGRPDKDVHMIFSTILVILMGRIMKHCTKNSSDKYDAITLDAYFQIFCKMGTDVYLMSDIWNMMKPFVEYVLVTYYDPVKAAEEKKNKRGQ